MTLLEAHKNSVKELSVTKRITEAHLRKAKLQQEAAAAKQLSSSSSATAAPMLQPIQKAIQEMPGFSLEFTE
jgi:hypothetical protein